MSEAMALETLASKVLGAHLSTAFTCTRLRLLADKKGYTDLDALACAPLTGHLAVAECKAQGPAVKVYHIADAHGLTSGGYLSSLRGSGEALLLDKNSWASERLQLGPRERPWEKLRHLELWLCANVYIAPEAVAAVEERLSAELHAALAPRLPAGVKVSGRIRSTLDLILDAFTVQQRLVMEYRWGVRSGDPTLDILRELVRYRNARDHDGDTGSDAVVQQHFHQRITDVLLGDPDPKPPRA